MHEILTVGSFSGLEHADEISEPYNKFKGVKKFFTKIIEILGQKVKPTFIFHKGKNNYYSGLSGC